MHTYGNHEGMKTLIITSMQDSSTFESGVQVIIEGVKLEEPTEIVHYTEIAKFYGLNNRDVWPLVHSNAMGNRFAYNGGETLKGKNANRNERFWKTITDANGNQTKVERIRRVPYTSELDDGMYVKLEDVLYFADSQGWTKGGGKPKSKEAQQTTSDLSLLSQQIAELTRMMALTVEMQLTEKKAHLEEKVAEKKSAK